MLSESLKTIIRSYNAGAIATINDDGTPAVSPKATFVIIDDACIAFGDIRSPGTISNLIKRPDVEINFIDVLTRRAARIKGRAEVVPKESDAAKELLPLFEELWSPYVNMMKHFVKIRISQAQLITSPAYDIGISEEELVQTNLDKLKALH